MNDKWLENLKVGDTVFVDTSQYGAFSGYRAKVKRFTKSGNFIIVESDDKEIRFRKSDGLSLGNKWHWDKLKQWNDEIREKILMHNLKKKALHLRQSLPIPNKKEELIAFIKALKPFIKTDTGEGGGE